MRELEKIKRERAEEKARLESEQSASDAASREAEIATSNPLLNLAAALGQAPGVNTTVPGTFQVKKRWDDGIFHPLTYSVITFRAHIYSFLDLIFKNQAMDQKSHGNFVNDLLRTEFHRYAILLPFELDLTSISCKEIHDKIHKGNNPILLTMLH